MVINDNSIKKLVANVLKYGVRTVLSVGIFGGFVYLYNNSSKTVDYSTFQERDQNIFKVFEEIIQGIFDLDGSSIIYLGIIILFLTPFIRLILSLISFALEKDKLYVAITLTVLFIISLSVYFGYGH